MEEEFKGNMERALRPLRITLQLSGLWPPDLLYFTGLTKVLFTILGYFNILEYILVTSFEFVEIAYRWPNLANVTTIASTATTGVLSSVKLLMLYVGHKHYSETITIILRNEFALQMPFLKSVIDIDLDEKNETYKDDKTIASILKLRKYLRESLNRRLLECKVIFYLSGIFVVSTLIGYIIPQALRTIQTGKYVDENDMMNTPFKTRMPFNEQAPTGYIVSFAIQIWCSFITVPGYTGADTLLTYHLVLTGRQFAIITHILENIEEYAAVSVMLHRRGILNKIKYDQLEKYEGVRHQQNAAIDGKDIDEEEIDEMCVQILMQCIVHYEKLMSFVNSLNKAFAVVLIFQLLSSSLLICLVLFKYKTESSSNKTTYLTYIGAATCQLFQYCWYSQIIINKSQEVGDAVYCTNWYKFSTSYKKSAIMLMRQSQRPCTITAMGFTDLSLPTFTSILSTAMSYLALLNSFLEEA